jgi:hypothetical protein
MARALVVVPAVDESKEQVEVRRHGGRDRHRRMAQARYVGAVTRREQVNDEPGDAVADRARHSSVLKTKGSGLVTPSLAAANQGNYSRRSKILKSLFSASTMSSNSA